MICLGIYVGRDYWLRHYGNRINMETEHYTISSTATQPQTILIGKAVESLYAAYTGFFRDLRNINRKRVKLKLVLYKDRKEFAVHNRNSSWAEAFYQTPYCHAYYSEGKANPYHWMIHEGTHQLNVEVAHFKIENWIDEGLATYFGTSTINGGNMLLGRIDVNTYPIWWLHSMSLTGNLQNDIKNGKIIPLGALITGNDGPDIDKHFNLYYLHYWSLTHFLFHYEGGKYSDNYRELIAEGGLLESFEKRIGPIDQIQREWYNYLQQKISEVDTLTRMVKEKQ